MFDKKQMIEKVLLEFIKSGSNHFLVNYVTYYDDD